ncbi:MAG: hypothetical protein J6U28_08970 [Bacteroidales bacterium]|nr:hypothetical protein [Bacteroidales bacterium]
MVSAFFATLGIVLAILVVIIAAIYGIVKIGLGGIGMIVGAFRNGFDKIRNK